MSSPLFSSESHFVRRPIGLKVKASSSHIQDRNLSFSLIQSWGKFADLLSDPAVANSSFEPISASSQSSRDRHWPEAIPYQKQSTRDPRALFRGSPLVTPRQPHFQPLSLQIVMKCSFFWAGKTVLHKCILIGWALPVGNTSTNQSNPTDYAVIHVIALQIANAEKGALQKVSVAVDIAFHSKPLFALVAQLFDW